LLVYLNGLVADTYTVSVAPPTLGGCNLVTNPITVVLPVGGNSPNNDFRNIPPPDEV
jgi:hypothetical protein